MLEHYDLVCFMGGSGSGIARTIGEEGIATVRRFVEDGGAYIGVCAGAYLATAGYDWSLHILNARTLHTGNQWRRGRGEVIIELTDHGRLVLGLEDQRVPVSYVNGPMIGPAGRERPAVFTRNEVIDSKVAGTSPRGGMGAKD